MLLQAACKNCSNANRNHFALIVYHALRHAYRRIYAELPPLLPGDPGRRRALLLLRQGDRSESPVEDPPNGTGCAFQRKGQKTWTAQYTVPTGWYLDENGKRHRKYKTKGGFKTKADALNYIETLRKENDRKPCPPLSEYWKQYSEGDLLKLGPDKIMAYKIAWRRMEKLSARRVDTISLNEMQDCVDSETKTFYPAKDMKQLFKKLFARAAAEKLKAEGEAEYMRILSEIYDTPEEADFYEFMRALDMAEKSLGEGNKTLVVSADSPIAKIFKSVE